MRRSWRIPRRTFLRGAGACIGLPFLDVMTPERVRAADKPQRLLLLWHPNGYPYYRGPNPAVDPMTYIASGSRISTALASQLDPVKSYVSWIEGLTMVYYKEGDSGAANHCGFPSFYTGARLGKGTPDASKQGVSIDQIVARTGPRTKGFMLDVAIVPVLRNGQAGVPAVLMNTASWRGPDDGVVPFTNPAMLFKKFFGVAAPAGKVDPATEQLERQRLGEHRLALDVVNQNIKSLRTRLGIDDRAKLDEYLTGIEELDRQTMRILANEQVLTSCKLEGISAPSLDGADAQQYVDKLNAFQGLVLKAFECDVARVVSFMHAPVAGFGAPNFETIVPGLQTTWNGGTYAGSASWHPISHHNSPYGSMIPDVGINLNNFIKLCQWHYKKVGDLALRMKNTILPGGENLLDSTLISWGSGISFGASHQSSALVHTLIGKGGGAFKGGVRVDFATATSLMNVWVAVLNGFGIPTTSFGNSTGSIPEILT